MADYTSGVTEISFLPSTTFEWKKCRVAESSAPQGCSTREASSFQIPPRRDPVKPLGIEIRYRGGPEASFDVRFRGRTWRFPGHMQMIDVMQFINGA